jgi:predicted nuclease of predicted toxin-antitoxin system
MKFLLDSCISSFAVRDLRDAGYDVLWIPEIGKDPGDDAILQEAFDKNLILVTADKDFGELVFVFGKPHPAVIRLVDIPAKNQGKVLLRLISTHRSDIEKQALITVDRYRVRVRLSN